LPFAFRSARRSEPTLSFVTNLGKKFIKDVSRSRGRALDGVFCRPRGLESFRH
jgi:hypothetical protein